eukprot:SAG11_NODE_2723_length_3043_cov_5.018003_3_plen_86_part_00
MTLIAPLWGSYWWPTLTQLCLEPPRLLPQTHDLFLKQNGSPLTPPRWRTAAFRIHGALAHMPRALSPKELQPILLSAPRQRRRNL